MTNRPNNRPKQIIPQSARDLELPLDQMSAPLDWGELFGRPGAPCAIEIGTGNGVFLEKEAAGLADWNFIGVEHEPLFFWKMAKRCVRAGLVNVRVTRCDAFELLEQWIPSGSVSRLYCYFSDPWPKRRHRDRRLFGPRILPLLERILAPGAEVRFKTDMDYYFNLAVTAFRERGGWEFIELIKRPEPDPAKGEVVSNYERKAREAGSQVWGFHARRTRETE